MEPAFVKYLSHPNQDQIRWGACDDPRQLLEVGKVYEVACWESHTWHTKVLLKGIPGRFNSVSFEATPAPVNQEEAS